MTTSFTYKNVSYEITDAENKHVKMILMNGSGGYHDNMALYKAVKDSNNVNY